MKCLDDKYEIYNKKETDIANVQRAVGGRLISLISNKPEGQGLCDWRAISEADTLIDCF